MIQQTGFLFKLDPTDYVTGASPLKNPEVNPQADWTSFVPRGEKQYKYAGFDTFSCTTFSLMNIIETWVMYHLKNNNLSQKQIEKLNSLGFFADNQFNCSDRFSAIMSGTMPNGNYFQNVLNSVRNDGVLCEYLLPFGGNNQAEYLNKALITEDMKKMAKQFLDIFEVSYEWVTDNVTIPSELKQCPIQSAIPKQATHAVEQISKSTYFDSYEPYIKPIGEIGYAMKVIVKVKKEVEVKPEETKELYKPKNFALKELVSPAILTKFGEKAWEFFDERVLKNLQFIRDSLGPIKVNNGTTLTYRGFDACEYRLNGVSQHNHGRAIDFDVVGKTAKEVREWIVKNQDKLPEPNCFLEDDVTWVHMDVRFSNKKGVYLFKE
jgi:hypothetical protein